MKHVLCNLHVYVNHGVVFKSITQLLLQGFTYANWVTCLDDRKSTSDMVLFYGANAIF